MKIKLKPSLAIAVMVFAIASSFIHSAHDKWNALATLQTTTQHIDLLQVESQQSQITVATQGSEQTRNAIFAEEKVKTLDDLKAIRNKTIAELKANSPKTREAQWKAVQWFIVDTVTHLLLCLLAMVFAIVVLMEGRWTPRPRKNKSTAMA